MISQPHQAVDAFVALADSLTSLHRAYEQTRESHGGKWLPDSPAARAVEDAARTPWGERAIIDAYLNNQLLVLSAGDHLRSLAVLLPNQTCGFYAVFTLARASAEAAARAWHIYEPDLVTEERARRHNNEILLSLHDQGMALRNLKMDDAPAQDAIREILGFAAKRGLSVTPATDRREPFIGKRRDRFAYLLRQILAEDRDGGNTAAVVHQTLSAVAHGTAHGLMSLLAERTSSGTKGVSNARIRLVPGETVVKIAAAPLCYAAAVERTIREHGWDSTEFDLALVPVMGLWRHVLNSAQVEHA